ncbi:UDP-N-acetylmuramoyl-tripeptide--D-alanyl-D-alanine ligase [Halobacillus salinarum]|uniref:UDP-N-acetylmuramoyl-tripeptide--D-alanyl-D-alanine ligase n=1 Tax=Halobacillus salinarum TaxID=2932257 RepID=A0ABY4ELZ8_9BACI|nr:UDP-N-acetylmuramoyl-tripeptide--D-alanyl-D-alanine ligase [Halobacillus salinarum]UOQ43136.1 UDP-N-acetylmuramoyl-tripeptide--D-alanyl-D-alanine ligase [Halobacillus salinarum]
MKLEAAELTKIFPNFKGVANDRIPLKEIMTDTREETRQSLFIPIIGESFDAHDFMKKAIQHGAVAALWQEDKPLPSYVPTDFPVFFVQDTTEALQKLAAFYLNKVTPIVVGVTGSNGKTTTKDIAASVLATAYRTHKTSGNFNNHIGLPLTILSMPYETEALVLEMGMNHKGEISLLSNLAKPHYGIITNIGESHLENLGSKEGIAEAKLEIMEGLTADGKIIIDGDEPLLSHIKSDPRTVSCGFMEPVNYLARIERREDQQTTFYVNSEKYELPMAGRHNVKNASYIIALGEQLSISKENIQSGLKQLKMSGMRFEKHEGINHSLIINDAYNASPTSMKAVIEVVSQWKSKEYKVLVLGDMLELGSESRNLHGQVGSELPEEIDAVYTIGNEAEEISLAAKKAHPSMEARHFNHKEELAEQLLKKLSPETIVLLKASRKMKLEELLLDLTD